ncbi:MAG: methylenetetrahydrofolate--tRNA-(uracil(54)-C(5))-methyltransferase (FADH(2)-oxidizing) TrmFO [Gemmatimonadota bacterium]
MRRVRIIGGGLAGSEAALQCARAGVPVTLHEMRPARATPAHRTDRLAELVCSNSFKTSDVANAHGLLKAELERLSCALLEIALESRIPAGAALGVDRERFAGTVTARVLAEPTIELVRAERTDIDPGEITIVATGPLTSETLTRRIETILGAERLAFYDAISPIVATDSLAEGRWFAASRYGKGGDDYVNCPLDEAGYEAFVDALLEADPYPLHAFERTMFFEGCLPIEEMVRRGRDTLRFGPLKPVGLMDPRTGARPQAVLQLRRENADGTMLNLVGCQTRLRYGDQRRVFGLVPALAGAEFLRYGQVHRNTFLRHPTTLDAVGRPREGWPYLFFAGQLTGVEGYVESIMSGLVAGWNAVRLERGEEPRLPPRETMIGSLYHYLRTADPDGFQPMNANFGLLPPPVPSSRDKRERRRAQVGHALAAIEAWATENDPALAAVR